MKLVYTCCSNNYLAQAKILGDSLIAHNPDYTFIICLVDTLHPEIDYSFFEPHTIIPISDIPIPEFETIWKRYNIVELNTCVKASCCKYLLHLHANCSHILYLDPDIMIFDSLSQLEREFETSDILLTPHITTPIPHDGKEPQESVFLNYGIYNLGFIGLKNKSEETNALLDWWEQHTIKRGYIDICNGVFVDQLYMNHAPLFFKKVKICTEFGYNAAPWNLHERHIIETKNSKFKMNDNSPLVFYHFSSFSYTFPQRLSRSYTRYSFDNCSCFKPLYKQYLIQLHNNRVTVFSKIPCYYTQQRDAFIESQKQEIITIEIQKQKSPKSLIIRFFRLITPPFIWDIFGIFNGFIRKIFA